MKDNNRNIKLKVFVFIIATVILVFLFVVIFLRPFIGSMLLGFGTRQPNSIELIRYDRLTGDKETILITKNEAITELYNAICYANIKKIDFDGEGVETNCTWEIVLHFSNNDAYLSTQGEGAKDSIYYRRYINQDTSYDFVEIWLDNSKLIDILSEYQ